MEQEKFRPFAEKLLSYRETGRVIYFDKDAYPADYEKEYSEIIREYAEKYRSPYIGETENLSYTEYETEDGTEIFYLLNIDWWDDAPAKYTLTINVKNYKKQIFGNDPLVLTVKDGVCVYTDNLFADVERIENGAITVIGFGKTAVHILTEKEEKVVNLNLNGQGEIKISRVFLTDI